MKIRNGFVSNSSTTSFCIMGDWIDFPKEYDSEDFDDLCCDNDLVCHYADGWDDLAVGMHPEQMQDNETLSQFKARVLFNMKQIGLNIDDINLRWIEKSYYS